MKQYLLSVHSVEGAELPPPGAIKKMYQDTAAFNAEIQAEGSWVFSGGLHPPSTATVVRAEGGEVMMTDGPFAEGKEHIGGFTDHQGARPRRRAGLGPQARPGDHACRSRCARSRTRPRTDAARAGRRRARDRAGLPRGVRPRGGRPGPRLRRHRHRRGGGPGRVHRRRCSAGRPPGCRRARPAGSSPPPATARSTGSAARRPATTGTPRPRCCTRRDEPAGGGSRARRPAAADLHLLPPGARHRRPGRADAAAARRADHRGDRARVPGARADHGPAAGPGQGQDPRRADPLPGARPRPTCPTGCGPCWPSST